VCVCVRVFVCVFGCVCVGVCSLGFCLCIHGAVPLDSLICCCCMALLGYSNSGAQYLVNKLFPLLAKEIDNLPIPEVTGEKVMHSYAGL